MQYFTIVARNANGRARACAMLQATDLDQAAERARQLVGTEHLGFVERNSRFAVRRSSRRETSLLQSYLASCNGAKLAIYLSEDLGSLLWRRGSLLLSFFMMLYLAPDKLRKLYGPTSTAPDDDTTSENGGTGGSGGITQEERDITPGGLAESPSIQEEDTSAAEAGSDGEIDAMASPETGKDEPIDSSNHLSALDDILNGGAEETVRDADVDLGDLL